MLSNRRTFNWRFDTSQDIDILFFKKNVLHVIISMTSRASEQRLKLPSHFHSQSL